VRGSSARTGRSLPLSEVAYAMGDGWETATWLGDSNGQRRYLGHGEYLTRVSDGLLVQQVGGGEPRLIPRDALVSNEPERAAKVLPRAGRSQGLGRHLRTAGKRRLPVLAGACGPGRRQQDTALAPVRPGA